MQTEGIAGSNGKKIFDEKILKARKIEIQKKNERWNEVRMYLNTYVSTKDIRWCFAPACACIGCVKINNPLKITKEEYIHWLEYTVNLLRLL